MPVSYDDVIGYLSGREGEPCAISGHLVDEGDLVATDADVSFAMPEHSSGAPEMSLSVSLGSIEPVTCEGHAGNSTALLDDDGIEIGTLTLTRDAFVNAAFDPDTGALQVGMRALTAAHPLALVAEREHARELSRRKVGGWMWSFSFGASPGGEADA